MAHFAYPMRHLSALQHARPKSRPRVRSIFAKTALFAGSHWPLDGGRAWGLKTVGTNADPAGAAPVYERTI